MKTFSSDEMTSSRIEIANDAEKMLKWILMKSKTFPQFLFCFSHDCEKR